MAVVLSIFNPTYVASMQALKEARARQGALVAPLLPPDRAEAPALRLALASILATNRPTQIDTARCGVNMRRAVASLRVLKPREGAPSPAMAIKELERACEACGGCRGI